MMNQKVITNGHVADHVDSETSSFDPGSHVTDLGKLRFSSASVRCGSQLTFTLDKIHTQDSRYQKGYRLPFG